MLSSRYLHLHEALGLGVMWLQQGAKCVPPERSSPATPPKPKPTLVATPAKTARQQTVSPAHAATLAAIGRPKIQTAIISPPVTPAPEPVVQVDSVQQHQQALAKHIQAVKLMVISICPAPEDSLAGQLFSGEVGVLLNKMLAAIGLQPHQVHKTSWLDTTVFSPNPSAAELSAAQPRLAAELALAQPQAILFLGQFFTQAEQQARLEDFRQGLPMFTVPHPARLLRQPHLKAEAWETLQKLQKVL